MLSQGTPRRAVRSLATSLLHIIRLMDLNCIRIVDLSEIERAGLRWKTEPGFYKNRRSGETSRHSFVYLAKRFCKFHNLMERLPYVAGPNEIMVANFRHFLKEDRGMAPETLRC
jgi:hypothetical protein